MFPSADTTYLSASALTAAPSVMPLEALRVTLFPLTGTVVTLRVPPSPVALTRMSPRAVAVPASMPWTSSAWAFTTLTALPSALAVPLNVVSSLFSATRRMSPPVDEISARPVAFTFLPATWVTLPTAVSVSLAASRSSIARPSAESLMVASLALPPIVPNLLPVFARVTSAPSFCMSSVAASTTPLVCVAPPLSVSVEAWSLALSSFCAKAPSTVTA